MTSDAANSPMRRMLAAATVGAAKLTHSVATARRATDEIFPVICREKLREAHEAGWRPDEANQYCWRCGVTMHASAVTEKGCAACLNARPAWAAFTRLGEYRPPLSEWVLDMKFHHHWQWASWFGRELAGRIWPPHRADRTIICPVPMHWRRRWRRGYNQSLLISQAIGRAWGLPVADVLVKTRATRPQVSVAHSERQANIRGAFRARDVDLRGWEVWLVDDVKTTGATMSACARQLRKAGAERIHGVVAAVAGR